MIRLILTILMMFSVETFVMVAHADQDVVLGKDIKFGSEMRIRHQRRSNTPSSVRNELDGYTDMRLRVFTEFKAEENLSIVFVPQFVKNAGNGDASDGLLGNTSVANNDAKYRNEGESSGNSEVSLGLLEGYIKYTPLEDWHLKMGRQGIKLGDGLLLNNPKFNNTGRVFDAVHGQVDVNANYRQRFFLAKINDGADSNLKGNDASDDVLFAGLYSELQVWDIDELDLYVINFEDKSNGVNTFGKSFDEKQKTLTYGVRLKEKMGKFDLLTELTHQSGENLLSGSSYNILGELKYSFSKEFKMAFEYSQSSKDFRTFYTSRHKYLGYMDVLGRRNVTSYRLRKQFFMDKKWKFQLDVHHFERTDTSGEAWNHIINATVGDSSLSDSSHIGNEVDLSVKYKASQKLTFNMIYGQFYSGSYLKADTNQVKQADYSKIEMEVKF